MKKLMFLMLFVAFSLFASANDFREIFLSGQYSAENSLSQSNFEDKEILSSNEFSLANGSKDSSICDGIETSVNEANGEKNSNSPVKMNGSVSPIIIHKIDDKGSRKFYLSLCTTGTTMNEDASGVTVVFTDGSKWTNPIKLDVEKENDSYVYKAFIKLTFVDRKAFKTRTIQRISLDKTEQDISLIDAEKFKGYVNCILKN